jgi:replicative DNA helicase
LEAVGGAHFITQLSQAILSSAHLETHARLIIEKHLGRELIKIGGEAVYNGYDQSLDVFEAMEKTEIKMYQLSSLGVKKKVKPVKQAVMETLMKISKLKDRNVDFTGVNTGFPPLNECTGGWQSSDLIIIGARPSVGKTAFAINTGLNAAADPEYGCPVALFSLEMDVDQLIQRMLSCISAVPLDHIRKPKKMDREEMERVEKAGIRLSNMKIHIDDTAGLTSMELRAKCRKLVSQDGVGLIIIDYLQLMECDKDKGENREQQISKISRDLKKMAKDLNVPVIALSQMSRSVDTQNREPQLSDLRESGAIEQDADLVMFLYRPTEKALEKKPDLKGKVLGTIKKNRQGALADVVFDANNRIQRWTENMGTSSTGETDFQLQNYHQPVSNITKDDLPF